MSIPRVLIAAGLMALAAGLSAQTPAPKPEPAPTSTPPADQAAAANASADTRAQPATAAPETTQPGTKRPRAISSDLARMLSASMPKYDPPKAKEETKPESEEAAPTPEEQPKNQIIRLPRMVVEGQRPPVFTEREVNTSKGLADLAVKRYFNETGLALNRFRLPLFGMGKEAYAMMLYEEEERLRQINDANDKIYLLREVDPAAAAKLQDDVNAAYLRKSDFTPVNGTGY